MDEAGLLIFVNPGDSTQTLKLPLSEPSLELGPEDKVEIDDWTNLFEGQKMSTVVPTDPPEILMEPGDIKIFTINLRSK
jgi:hypothetical protein